MSSVLRQFRDFFVSLKLTVFLLALSIVLVFAALLLGWATATECAAWGVLGWVTVLVATVARVVMPMFQGTGALPAAAQADDLSGWRSELDRIDRLCDAAPALCVAALPDLPTVAESGVPQYSVYEWNGVLAPAGVPPEVMGIGPVAAIPKVLARAGIGQDALDWIELNEAFAAQSLAVIRELKLDPAKVNPLGGAIALGHPLGATGAIRTATLLHGLRRRQQKYGMVTMCIGTGMGAAGVFEAL